MRIALPTLGLALLCGGWTAEAVAQARLHGPVMAGQDLSLDIRQSGAAQAGAPGTPILLEGNGLALQIEQIGPSTARVQVRTAEAPGAPQRSSSVRVEQRGEGRERVAGAEASILAGLQSPASGLDLTLQQRGDGARAEIRVATGGAVHGLTLGLAQAQAAAASIEVTAGSNGVIAWTQGLGATGSLTSTGDNLRASIAQAPGSRVDIANAGHNNSYTIATQQAGDALALGVTGSNNSFAFDFQGYREVAWRNAVTNGGSYRVSDGAVVDQANRVVGAAAVIGR